MQLNYENELKEECLKYEIKWYNTSPLKDQYTNLLVNHFIWIVLGTYNDRAAWVKKAHTTLIEDVIAEMKRIRSLT